ncbi:Nn.00g053450.m01.CDS01 [Neocucurbitaria sp. VM-36]
MESYNLICGVVMSEKVAEHYLGLTRSLYKTALFALQSNKTHNFASQTQSTWAVAAAKDPEPQDEQISAEKGLIASRHVSFYENWKGIKYHEYLHEWPCPEYRGTLWKTFARAMDQDRPMYQLRNWFSHSFGGESTTLAVEQDMFQKLLQEYENTLPDIKELMTKLEEGLEDRLAWGAQSEAYDLRFDEKPAYAQDCEAVLLEIKQKEEENQAIWRQAEINEKARLARLERERETGEWECEEWVPSEDLGAEWGVGLQGIYDEGWYERVLELTEGTEGLQESASNSEDVEAVECVESPPGAVPGNTEVAPVNDTEGLLVTSKPEDRPCGSGYEAVRQPAHHCKTCRCRSTWSPMGWVKRLIFNAVKVSVGVQGLS